MNEDHISPVSADDAATISSWDEEADIVVVGLGIAGLCAAIEAGEAGADVLALERTGAPGGTSALSGGILYLGGGTPLQRACGYDDDPANMAAFLTGALGPGADEPKIRAYCDASVDHYRWLVDHGVPFKAEFCDEPNREPVTDAGLLFSGGEDTWPFVELARPAPRGHHPEFPDTAGGFLVGCLRSALDATTARIITEARVDNLVADNADEGRVVGVRARVEGRPRLIRARQGVVLAGGGFIFNDAMVEHYCPQVLRAPREWRVGTDTDDGLVIRIAQGAGAALERMEAFECALPIGPPHRLARFLLVNSNGERFINEDAYTGRIGLQALLEQQGEVYMIVDEHMFETNFVGMVYTWVAETAEELATDIGLPPDRLAATIAEYNLRASEGVDPHFHKLSPWLVPLRPLYGAVDLRASTGMIYATFTLGGVATTADGAVRSTSGGIVPGLFAAGRTTAGLAAHGYVSGISLGDGSWFGRQAGRKATGSSR